MPVCCVARKILVKVRNNCIRRARLSNSYIHSHFHSSVLLKRPWISISDTVRYFHKSPSRNANLLPPSDVDAMLRANEYAREFMSGSIKSYETNQLPSNNPIEDTRCEAKCQLTTGLLIGIFDGHGGGACAQVISKRLFQYIAACLLPQHMLEEYLKDEKRKDLIKSFNDKVDIVEDLKPLYKKSYDLFLKDLSTIIKEKDQFDMATAFESAFLRLDSDISKEVTENFELTGEVNKKTLAIAASGAVACVAHIDGPHVHIANLGDCNAVIGSLSENYDWTAKKVTVEHNSDNQKEVQKILNEHPSSERETVIKYDRLLGQLAPLRSLGDHRYKWSTDIMKKIVVPHLGSQSVPPNYHTPPYLSASPDVYHHQLTPRDKFMVIASDGLWDMLSPQEVVKLVGEHMLGKIFFMPLKLPHKYMKLEEINEILKHRKEGLKSKPNDKNATTHLIRHALGATDYGFEYSRLSEMLSLPQDVSRLFRDDITVTIIYFDTEYLRCCPVE